MADESMINQGTTGAKKAKPKARKKPAATSGMITKRKFGVANITVVGVGGGGCNTVQRLLHEKPTGVNFVCLNTDARALQTLQGDGLIVLPIGESLTRGFGAGGNPQVGEEAAGSGRKALKQVLSGSDIVFICSGLGGGTGTGAGPVVAEIAKSVGATTVAMVTLPFSWEGHKRMETAMGGLSKLREKVDNLIMVHNDRIAQLVKADTLMQEAFKAADSAVSEGILVVSEIVNTAGDINVDLADIRAILAMPGNALMSIGMGSGANGAREATESAINNPLLDLSIKGAKGVLFTVKGGQKLTLGQVNTAGKLISDAVDPEATIFFGMTMKPEMGDNVKITVIATGIPDNA
ncbi:MAG: cell division protein FtsZ [Dehalococcoidia bacterium]